MIVGVVLHDYNSPKTSACAYKCVCAPLCFACCVCLAAMSSPFNIIFTARSDYSSYSFMQCHINDFIIYASNSVLSLFHFYCAQCYSPDTDTDNNNQIFETEHCICLHFSYGSQQLDISCVQQYICYGAN